MENPKGAKQISREIRCAWGGKNPEAPTARSACDQTEKAREGTVCCDRATSYRSKQEASEGKKPKGASGGDPWLSPKAPDGTPNGVLSPEGEAWPKSRSQLQEGSGARKSVRRRRRSKASKGETP